MPIYEYSCKSCGHEWEEMQKITDAPLTRCPGCGGRKAHRLISRSNFVLKGTGWYVTDYGRGTGGTAGESKKSTPPKKAETSSKTSSDD